MLRTSPWGRIPPDRRKELASRFTTLANRELTVRRSRIRIGATEFDGYALGEYDLPRDAALLVDHILRANGFGVGDGRIAVHAVAKTLILLGIIVMGIGFSGFAIPIPLGGHQDPDAWWVTLFGIWFFFGGIGLEVFHA